MPYFLTRLGVKLYELWNCIYDLNPRNDDISWYLWNGTTAPETLINTINTGHTTGMTLSFWGEKYPMISSETDPVNASHECLIYDIVGNTVKRG